MWWKQYIYIEIMIFMIWIYLPKNIYSQSLLTVQKIGKNSTNNLEYIRVTRTPYAGYAFELSVKIDAILIIISVFSILNT